MATTHRKVIVLDQDTWRSDFGRLRPGDVIFALKGNDAASNAIFYYQNRHGYRPLANEASHVALYVGRGDVIHATAKEGVNRQSIMSYFAGRRVAAATWKSPEGWKSGRKEAVRQVIATAERLLGEPYEFLDLARHILTGNREAQPLICSTFIDRVFDEVFDFESPLLNPENPRTPVFSPAHVFEQEGLVPLADRGLFARFRHAR